MSVNPFRSIVIPAAPTITPDEAGQVRSWVRTALVVTTWPQVVIGVVELPAPEPVASSATAAAATSAGAILAPLDAARRFIFLSFR